MFLLLPFVSLTMNAQDFHLSQYDASPMLINPALTGGFKGDLRAVLHHRSQWASIISNPFRSTAISVDSKLDKFNIGGYILHSTAGTGNFTASNFILSGSYDYRFKGKPHNHITLGAQAGAILKSVDFNKLTFEDQYDPANGGSFINTSAESAGLSSKALPDVNVGFMYYYTNTTKKINPFIGASAYHLTRPNEGLLGGMSRLPIRYNANTGIKVNINKKFQFLAHAIWMKQENVEEIMFGWKGYYYLESKDAFATYGIIRRTNDDAVIGHIGLKYGQYQYRISYDFNTSNLQTVSNSRGGFEISIIYTSHKVNPTPKRTCPDL